MVIRWTGPSAVRFSSSSSPDGPVAVSGGGTTPQTSAGDLLGKHRGDSPLAKATLAGAFSEPCDLGSAPSGASSTRPVTRHRAGAVQIGGRSGYPPPRPRSGGPRFRSADRPANAPRVNVRARRCGSRLSAKPTGGETSTGLGQSIVKRIVDLHEAERSQPKARDLIWGRPSPSRCYLMSNPQHIVVVDDEAPAREVGVGIICACTAWQRSPYATAALRPARSDREQVPDLIVLDLDLPEEARLSIIRDHLAAVPAVAINMLISDRQRHRPVVGLELEQTIIPPTPANGGIACAGPLGAAA